MSPRVILVHMYMYCVSEGGWAVEMGLVDKLWGVTSFSPNNTQF